MKRFHVSKNLIPEIRSANGWVIGYRNGSNGTYVSANNQGEWLSPKISISAGTTFTVSAMPIDVPSMSIYFWNGDTYIGNTNYSSTDYSGATFTAPVGTTQFDFAIRAGADKKTEETIISSGFWVMLNTGSTPLPYEPYGNTWQTKSPPRYGTATDTLTSFPAEIKADGTNASADIIGNMSQSGTPSPSSPITPSECGNKTANLFDKDNALVYNAYLAVDSESSIWITSEDSRSVKMPCEPNTQYTLSISSAIPIFRISVSSNANIEPSVEGVRVRTITRYENIKQYTFTTSANDACIIFQGSASFVNEWINSLMLVEGSTAPSTYIPYGIKIPISSGGVTTPVYLGQVTSTRKIKKLVLTGEETWQQSGAASNTFYFNVSDYLRQRINITICSHFSSQVNINGAVEMQNGNVSFYANSGQSWNYFYVRDNNFATLQDFKTYLQQQYDNGTPVTVWYVLAEPTTSIVNEPIRKIGDYADSISVTGIPTTAGSQTFDIDTTLKPSEVDLTYHGWHRKEPKERVNGQWE